MLYTKSRWIHAFPRTDAGATTLLHGIQLDVAEADSELLALLERFAEPTTVADAAAAFPDPQTAAAAARELIALRYLVPAGTDEVQVWRDERDALIDRQGSGKLSLMRVMLTEQCNLRCTYCFEDFSDNAISWETLKAVLDQVIETNGTRPVGLQFFGGEPLLRFDRIKQAVEYLHAEQRAGRAGPMGFTLTTNGTLVTAEKAAFFAKHQFTISISLDGVRSVNDLQRRYLSGHGSYDMAVRGMKLLKAHGCNDVGILLTPTDQTVPTMPEFFRYAVQELGAAFYAVNTPQPGLKGWGLDGAAYARAAIACHELARELGVPFQSTLDKVLVAFDTKRGPLSSCFNPQGDRCASATVEGRVSPCIVSWDEELLRPLGELKRPDMFLEESYEAVRPDCLSCPALNICGGPCHLENMYMQRGGDWDHARCAFFHAAVAWAVDHYAGEAGGQAGPRQAVAEA